MISQFYDAMMSNYFMRTFIDCLPCSVCRKILFAGSFYFFLSRVDFQWKLYFDLK